MLIKEYFRPACLLLLGGLVWSGLQGRGVAEESTIRSRSISWRTSYARAAEEAVKSERPLLIEFTAVWCGACRQMQQLTFSNSRVIDRVQDAYIPLVIDADAHRDLVDSFHIQAFPTTLIVSPELKILKRFTGFQPASTLLAELERGAPVRFTGKDRVQLAVQEVIPPVSAASPSNQLSFAFEGFCLVSILDERKLRRGDGEFKTTYRDQELCFHSEQHLKRFLAQPERYWPMANGKCLVSERDDQQDAVGDPRVGVTWRGRLWLFSDRESQRRFIQSPRRYTGSGM